MSNTTSLRHAFRESFTRYQRAASGPRFAGDDMWAMDAASALGECRAYADMLGFSMYERYGIEDMHPAQTWS